MKYKVVEETNEELILAGYVVLWGGTDLQGERFTPDTNPTTT